MLTHVKISQVYQHARTGQLYRVFGTGLVKKEGKWVPAVIYRALRDLDVTSFYTRDLENFKESFQDQK